MKATGTFTFDAFNRSEPYFTEGAVSFARSHIEKTFAGDVIGKGVVEMMAAVGTAGPAAYVALEHLKVSLHGREGSFALVHHGLAVPGGREGRWNIVPGTGAGALAGITGTARIDIDPDGTHHITFDYALE